jgi:Flp pilus assembly protein TadG
MEGNSKKGSVLVLFALILIVLLAFAGFAIDGGYLYLQRTRLQQVADSSALACVINPSSDQCPTSGGNVYPLTNPYNFTVTINNPGDSSLCPNPNTQSKCASATATTTWNTFFIGVIGIKSLTLNATAIAGMTGANPCMIALGSTGIGISLTGSGALTTVNCGISVNQTGTSISNVGSGSITATPIKVMGSVSNVGSGTISPTTNVTVAATDPFASEPVPSFTPPPPSTCTQSTLLNYVGGTAHTIPAGNYCGGVSNVGSGNITLNPGYYNGISTNGSATVTFNPGNYVIYGSGLNLNGSGPTTMGSGNYVIYGGGAAFTGSGNVSGSNILIYNTGNSTWPAGSINATGSGGFNLSAATTGADAGMLIFQPASNSSSINIVGSGSSTFSGNIYAPTSTVTLTGSAGATLPVGNIISNNVVITGSGTISVTNAYNQNTTSGKPALLQ